MQAVVDLLIGSVTDPIKMAMIFMVFLAVIDALFSFIGTLFMGLINR